MVCRNRVSDEVVEQGGTRCDDCYVALANSPDNQDRREMAAEPYLPATIAALMSSDFDLIVAQSARRHLGEAEPVPVAAVPDDRDWFGEG